MSQRYKIRTFESGDQDGLVADGTVVLPIDRVFSIFCRSLEEAERKIKEELAEGKLPGGRVYQICPPFGSAESIRSFTVSSQGVCQRAYLDPASGVYSEFRRIRYADLRVNLQREVVSQLQEA